MEEVAKAVGGGYCRLQMPFKLALAGRGTVTGHRLGALEGGGGAGLPPFQCTPGPGPSVHTLPRDPGAPVPCGRAHAVTWGMGHTPRRLKRPGYRPQDAKMGVGVPSRPARRRWWW